MEKKQRKIGIETYIKMQAQLLSTMRSASLTAGPETLKRFSENVYVYKDIKADIDSMLKENEIVVAGFEN